MGDSPQLTGIEPPTSPSTTRASRYLRAARIAIGVATVVFAIAAVVQRWTQVRDLLSQINFGVLLLSGLCAFGATIALLFSWRAILTDLGSPLRAAPAARVMLLGQLGKYVPGSVWSVVAQTELAKDLGVPRHRSAVAGLVFNAVALLLGLGFALTALPALAVSSAVPGWFSWAVVLSPLALVALAPRPLTRLTNLGLRVLRRPPLDHAFTWRATLSALGWTTVYWLLCGVHIWILGLGLGADPVEFAIPALGGFAAAWSAGFLVILAPAGAGIRDVLLVVLLATALPGGAAAALIVALASRLLFVITDVVAAFAGHLLGRYSRPVLSVGRDPASL